jgi:EmrB/QacA subfamily drug resistance transporter
VTREPPGNVPTGSLLVLAAVGVGTFMSALDGSIVGVVLPVMRHEMNTSVASIQWVVTIYLLVVSGTLLGFGRLGDMIGHKSTYVWGFVVFVAGSALCGLAPGEASLVAFRAVQAIGAAMLFANSLAILTADFPPERRGRVLGTMAMMTYLGLTVGPPLGGWLAGAYGWRAIFFINVPIGVVAVAMAIRAIPNDSGELYLGHFDWVGAGVFLAGLTALVVALNQGEQRGWTSPAVLGLLVAAAVAGVAFIWLERRSERPMLDLALFSDMTFTASAVGAVLNYVTVYTVVFLMPFYLQQGLGLSPARTGLLLAVQSVVMAVVAPIAGRLSDRTGTRAPAVGGMVVLAAGLVALGLLGARGSQTGVAVALAVVGLGTGTFISPNSSALMGAAPRNRLGIASGVLAEARNVGMVLGVGLAGAVFTSLLGGAQTGPNPAFFNALSVSFFVAAGVAVAGAVACLFATGRPTTG